MNKRIPFIALLVGLELGLSQFTFGTIDIFTSMLALFSLRPKDFLIYIGASTPSFAINVIQYGTFYSTSGNSLQFDLQKGVYLGILHPWYFFGVTTLFFGYFVFTMVRSLLVVSSTNTLRKKFRIKPLLYPDFKERVRKKDFGDKIASFVRYYTIFLIIFLLVILVFVNVVVFKIHPQMQKEYNCWQLINNSTAFSKMSTVQYNALASALNC